MNVRIVNQSTREVYAEVHNVDISEIPQKSTEIYVKGELMWVRQVIKSYEESLGMPYGSPSAVYVWFIVEV
ncbi:hypothetical protein PS2_240 [Serratia phage PS2]|uniref:Uncharacterized protein n=1 Tax=Serratia phage PS2 TaxID=1481112 RepID=A0A023W5Y8_9CAUD|nr:hypothetical protein FF83_gp175 [Serratia phage PS2]AHY25478.1 hypothetical protein PS2_240 [Serratia phage PS2]